MPPTDDLEVWLLAYVAKNEVTWVVWILVLVAVTALVRLKQQALPLL
jgi:hypothetical protein